MTMAAIITLVIIVIAIFLFATEVLSIDLVALLIMAALVIGGVISPEEAVSGFSNKATITVMFMFIISGAILKTGALQIISGKFFDIFKKNTLMGFILLLGFVIIISAFMNNTPVIAVFIPVVIQIAKKSSQSASKFLIPLSYAAIWGGMCTLIGTSTNIIISGIAEKSGLEPLSMFQMSPLALILCFSGMLYLLLFGIKILPERGETDLDKKFGFSNYITELELLEGSDTVGKKIMNAPLIKELDLDVLSIKRDQQEIVMPTGDFVLKSGDLLKVRCDIDVIKNLKDLALSEARGVNVLVADSELMAKNVSLVEMVVASNSDLVGSTLRELDFRRRFRAIVLAIRQRKEVYDNKMKYFITICMIANLELVMLFWLK